MKFVEVRSSHLWDRIARFFPSFLASSCKPGSRTDFGPDVKLGDWHAGDKKIGTIRLQSPCLQLL